MRIDDYESMQLLMAYPPEAFPSYDVHSVTFYILFGGGQDGLYALKHTYNQGIIFNGFPA